MIKNAIVFFFLSLVLLINGSSFFDATQPLFRWLATHNARSFGLAQKWNMFSPDPTAQNPYTLVVGISDNDKTVNLATNQEIDLNLLHSPAKIPLGHNYLSYYLSQAGAFAHYSETKAFSEQLFLDMTNFYSKAYISNGSKYGKLEKVLIVQVLLKTISPGEIAKPEIHLLQEFKLNQ